MYNFKRRIDALKAAVEIRKTELSAHDPFVLFQPWSMLEDQYHVFYYPEGMYRPPEKYGLLSFSDACALMARWPGDLSCKISMGGCLEWLFVFHQIGNNSELYTQEQLERFLRDDLEKYPRLTFLLTTEEGRDLGETLARLPQSCVVRLEDIRRWENSVSEQDGTKC